MRFGGIALAAVLLVGACSGDPSPKEPTGSPSKPTPTSTATLPAMPDQAKEDSPEGAAAFVTYWVEVLNYAAATGDVRELSRLSTADCDGCQEYVELYRVTYEHGGYFHDADWTVDSVKLQGTDVETYGTFTAVTEPTRYRSDPDAEEVVGTGDDTLVSIAIQFRSGEWIVTQLGLGDVQ